MNNFITSLVSALLLMLGFIAGAALFFVFVFALAAVWLVFQVRSLWARLTGKPVARWSAGRFSPRQGFAYGYQSMRRGARPARPGHPAGRIEDDITDVVPRAPSKE